MVENKWRKVGRFRLGVEIKENAFWEKEGKKVARGIGRQQRSTYERDIEIGDWRERSVSKRR